MTLEAWLDSAIQDADRRGLPELKPLLEALARAALALRTADWNPDPSIELRAGPSTGLRAGETKGSNGR